jgi:hypothetical protein
MRLEVKSTVGRPNLRVTESQISDLESNPGTRGQYGFGGANHRTIPQNVHFSHRLRLALKVENKATRSAMGLHVLILSLLDLGAERDSAQCI